MKIAVTGASGHVGNNLCRKLLSLGHDLKGLKHHSAESLNNIEIELIEGDILNPASLDKLVKDTEIVFHLAAKIDLLGNKKSIFTTHVDGTKNIIDACIRNNVSRLIHFSTIHTIEHSNHTSPLDENRPLISKSKIIYESSKAKAEKLIQDVPMNILETVILNPTAIIGPNDYAPSMSGQLIQQLRSRSLPALIPGGYNWVDVRDVVHAASNAIKKGIPGNRYILSGKWHSLKEISILVEELTGRKTPKLEMPFFLAWLGLPFIQAISWIKRERPLYSKDSLIVVAGSTKYIDNSKAIQYLDFQPRPLRNTIQDTIEWFDQHKRKQSSNMA